MGKWTEVPYIQAFMVLYQNPTLHGSYNSKPGEPENSPDILDDPPSKLSHLSGGNLAPPTPDSIPTSPEPPTSLAPSD